MKKWNTSTFVAVGALAALKVVLSLPGGIVAALTGFALAAELVNIVVIGIMYPLVPLITKRVGAVTLFSLIAGVLFVPLPIIGPPGFLPKILYLLMWGLVADLTYVVFRRSERVAAIAIGATQIAPGAFLASFFWAIVGAKEMAAEVAKFGGVSFALIGLFVGSILGYAAYLIYEKLKNTAVVQRIQQ